MSEPQHDPEKQKALIRRALNVLQNYTGEDGRLNATLLVDELERLQSQLDQANARERKAFEALKTVNAMLELDPPNIASAHQAALFTLRSQDDSEGSVCKRCLGAGCSWCKHSGRVKDDSDWRAGANAIGHEEGCPAIGEPNLSNCTCERPQLGPEQ